jgi:hypothetical protein
VNFHKFHVSFSTRISQARTSQVLSEIGNENADECVQNAENIFGFDFLERSYKDD